jgi:hypothetical protein
MRRPGLSSAQPETAANAADRKRMSLDEVIGRIGPKRAHGLDIKDANRAAKIPARELRCERHAKPDLTANGAQSSDARGCLTMIGRRQSQKPPGPPEPNPIPIVRCHGMKKHVDQRSD